MRVRILPRLAAICLAVIGAATAAADVVGTAFTYQGRLNHNGLPANGQYDLWFRLYPGQDSIFPIGNAITLDNVSAVDGLFAVKLDFGDSFDGTERWLSVGVRPGVQSGAYTILSPRQELAATPHAVVADRVALPMQVNGDTDPGLLDSNALMDVRQDGSAPAVRAETSGSGPALLARAPTGGTALRLENGALQVAGPNPLAFTAYVDLQDPYRIVIDHPLTNGDWTAMLIITPVSGFNFATQEMVPPAPAYVEYDADTDRWMILPQPGRSFLPFTSYNVLIIKR